jgi:nitroreductase/NAD-dependent dihydropyrimidine dehydrogenase PreA subunit
MADDWFVDLSKCAECGACVDICPNRIIQKNADGSIYFMEERVWECFRCGQCMAVCPKSAIQVQGLSYEADFYPLPKSTGQEAGQFSHLIQSRRSFRSFQDRPVPHEMLEKIVDAIRLAPPGFPPVKTELVVVEDPEKIKTALPMMINLYDKLVKAMGNPFARQFVKAEAGSEKYSVLKNHLIPLLIDRLPDLKSGREDTLLRHAPALILFHADREAENYAPDIYIALTYGFLAAQSLGLGASAMDIIPPAVDKSRELRDLFQIPDNNIVVASMILGFPKHAFKLGSRRDLKSITWL